MRLFMTFLMAAMSYPAMAQAQQTGGDRAFPAPFAAILQKLSKAEADKMQNRANTYCKNLDYSTIRDLYTDISHCTLMQSTAIASVDTALYSLDSETPTKYRPDQIKKCWALYRALGSGDVQSLDHCFADIQYFELLQRVAGSDSPKPKPVASSYCDKVAQAAGGSYMILEECIKQENASRRRLGQ